MYTNVLGSPSAADSGFGIQRVRPTSSKELENKNSSSLVKNELDQLDALLEDLMYEINRPTNSRLDRSTPLSRTLVDHQPQRDAGYISDSKIRSQRHPIKLYRLDQAQTAPLSLRRIGLKSPTPLRDKPGVLTYETGRFPGTFSHGNRRGYETDTAAVTESWRSDSVGRFGARRRFGVEDYETDSSLLGTRRVPMCPIPETVVICQPQQPFSLLRPHEGSSGDDEPIVSVPVIQPSQNVSADSQDIAAKQGTPSVIQQQDRSDVQIPKLSTPGDFDATETVSVTKMPAGKPMSPSRQRQVEKPLPITSRPTPTPPCHSAVNTEKQGEVVTYFPPSVKENLKFWYKPKISREDAIRVLRDRPAGSFIIRDSVGFPGAYGLALKVSKPPPHVQIKPGEDIANELVRHYLIEPTPNGVRLKGCTNEPTYSNLSALVYHHSIEAIALPCKLVLPESDYDPTVSTVNAGTSNEKAVSNAQSKLSSRALLERGAACHVVYLVTMEAMSDLAVLAACQQCINYLFQHVDDLQVTPTIVHFRVSSKGITLTDVNKRLFFRRHYPVDSVLGACVDSDKNRYWTKAYNDIDMLENARCFGFISRKLVPPYNNECHIFVEYDPRQPAAAIVNFISKVMLAQ